ncbi:hypothetical protein B0H63DRAFT_551808 [Podospora didyma]|uniref:Uncharacterized protein n=1 Tax=Podospora didyma TaxID=330526 RepID=A0AAE0N584_9PEZI|nr:hypothetical protein B0H63DRAFT_551808 [Podospora didyma]
MKFASATSVVLALVAASGVLAAPVQSPDPGFSNPLAPRSCGGDGFCSNGRCLCSGVCETGFCPCHQVTPSKD